MRRVLFRTDVGPDIGLGHLNRCLALAAALRAKGVPSVFVTYGNAPSDYLVSVPLPLHRLPIAEPGSSEDLAYVLKQTDHAGCETIVVDSYQINAQYLAELRQEGLFVVAIDDLASYTFPCQLVVNGGVQAMDLPYRSSSGDTQFLLGPRYALLREEFWNGLSRQERERVQTVLVTLGGADPYNLMPQLLVMLDQLDGGFNVAAIVGPFFERRRDVEEIARACRRTIRIIRAPQSVRDLMVEADVAISAAGQTLYELARVGCPTVAVSIAENQEPQLRSFMEAGAVLLAGRAHDTDVVDKVRAALLALIADRSSRNTMGQTGRRLIDGHGAHRVVDGLLRHSARAVAERVRDASA